MNLTEHIKILVSALQEDHDRHSARRLQEACWQRRCFQETPCNSTSRFRLGIFKHRRRRCEGKEKEEGWYRIHDCYVSGTGRPQQGHCFRWRPISHNRKHRRCDKTRQLVRSRCRGPNQAKGWRCGSRSRWLIQRCIELSVIHTKEPKCTLYGSRQRPLEHPYNHRDRFRA